MALAIESCRKLCCSPSVPPLLPQPETGKHASPGLLADLRMASPLVSPSAGYLILAGIAVDGHSQLAESSQPHAAVTSAAVDLVVLSDSLVADPRMVRDLHSRGVPHLPVRVRDGTGLAAGHPGRDQLPAQSLGGITHVRQSTRRSQPGQAVGGARSSLL